MRCRNCGRLKLLAEDCFFNSKNAETMKFEEVRRHGCRPRLNDEVQKDDE